MRKFRGQCDSGGSDFPSKEMDSDQIHENFKKYVADINSGNAAAERAAQEGAYRDLEPYVKSIITQRFSTYVETDSRFREDLLQAGRIAILETLPKYAPEKSMPTTYFYEPIKHNMVVQVNRMKYDIKSHVATAKKKMREVDRRFEKYGRTPALHDYAYSMGLSLRRISSIRAEQRAGDIMISMDDPNEMPLADQQSIVCGPEESFISNVNIREIIRIAYELEPRKEIVQCFLKLRCSEAEVAELAARYGLSRSEIKAGIRNLEKHLRNHPKIQEMYPERSQRRKANEETIWQRTQSSGKGGRKMEKTDLYYLYDVVYSGQSRGILNEVSRDMLSNADIGFICRYACEYYLRWGPNKVIQELSGPVLQMMKIDNLVEKIKFPPEISPPERMYYLYYLMYPEYSIKNPKPLFVIVIYQSVLAGLMKNFPHSFFTGGDWAEQNAGICLMYALQVMAGCRTAEDCIQLMSSKQASSFLKRAKLYSIMRCQYKKPIAYVNDALMEVNLLDLKFLCLTKSIYMQFRKNVVEYEK